MNLAIAKKSSEGITAIMLDELFKVNDSSAIAVFDALSNDVRVHVKDEVEAIRENRDNTIELIVFM